MQARAEFCCCTQCLLGRYDSCVLVSEHGKIGTKYVPQLGALHQPQLVALQEWAGSLVKGQIVAFVAAQVDVHMEGVYWLAVLLDATFPATAAMAYASDCIEEGWMVVKAKWYMYKFEPDSQHPKGLRGYSLLDEERILVVGTCMLWLKDIAFEETPRRNLRPAAVAAGPAAAGRGRGRGRGGASGGRGSDGNGRGANGGARGSGQPPTHRQELSWLGVDMHNLILGCVREALAFPGSPPVSGLEVLSATAHWPGSFLHLGAWQ